jgi:hypothetical protein
MLYSRYFFCTKILEWRLRASGVLRTSQIPGHFVILSSSLTEQNDLLMELYEITEQFPPVASPVNDVIYSHCRMSVVINMDFRRQTSCRLSEWIKWMNM